MRIPFRADYGDWTRFRALKPREFDLQRGADWPREIPYEEAMQRVSAVVLAELSEAQKTNTDWLLIRHGASTSQSLPQTTSRSVVRAIMRSRAATPFIIRRDCVQHETVFLARIRRA